MPAAQGASQGTTVADLDVGMAVQNVLLAAQDAGLDGIVVLKCDAKPGSVSPDEAI